MVGLSEVATDRVQCGTAVVGLSEVATDRVQCGTAIKAQNYCTS